MKSGQGPQDCSRRDAQDGSEQHQAHRRTPWNEPDISYLNPGSPKWTPSIIPDEHDHTVYLVADDFKSGCVWCETDYQDTGLERVIC
jgi:hypothetical protein